MSTCRRCGGSNTGKGICGKCLSKWTDMRKEAWQHCEVLYGKLTPETHPLYIKEMKRLERIWKKDSSKFEQELISKKRDDKIERVLRKNNT